MSGWPFYYLFWIGFAIIFYAYIGYGLLLWLLLHLKRWFIGRPTPPGSSAESKVTFIVCAYNEEKWIAQKIENSLQLEYPTDSIRFVVMTDGSDDQTTQIAQNTFEIASKPVSFFVLHEPARKGKIAAFHRAMTHFGKWDNCSDAQHVIVSTDANTLLNKSAVQQLIRHFQNPKVGAVAGEKRIKMDQVDAASAAGEGIYWRYESTLKKWDAELWSVVGAAGELFAFRSDLYEPVPEDTIVEDFYLTTKIAMKGYRVAYEPTAYAVESSSASVAEELKRKVRIAAGGLQAAWRLLPLINVFQYGTLSFQYISHRLLRWTIAPLLLPLLLFLSLTLALQNSAFFQWVFFLQLLFYSMAALGWIMEQRKIKAKLFFIPYYFCLMNYAMYAGFIRLIQRKQTVIWEKSERAD